MPSESSIFDSPQFQAIWSRIRHIPIVETLQIKIEEFSDGYCVASVPRDKKYDGIYASLHGGLLMTIADSIACFAIMTMTGPDQALTTTDMNIRFLAPCLTDVTAKAKVIKLGRSLCPVGVDLFDASSKQVAVAQVTYMRLDGTPKHFNETS